MKDLRAVASHFTPRPPGQAAPGNGRGNKRERIIGAALRLFANETFQRVTMDQVAKAADVAKGTLYLYFPSKESLYLGVISSGFEAAAQSVERVTTSTLGAEEKLRRAVSATIEFYDGQRDFLRLLSTEEPRLAPARGRLLGGWRERGFKYYSSIIEAGVAAGIFRPTDARLATLAIIGTIRSVLLYYGNKRPVRELSDEVGRIVLEGLVSKPLATHANGRHSK